MKYIFMILGFLFMGLGSVGIALPMLPTTPFFIAAAFCFAKSSDKLHRWFLSTKLYRKHLESFVKDRTMTMKTKASILTSVTILMGTCFLLLEQIPVARLIIFIIWVCHVLYFIFRVRTAAAATDGNNNFERDTEEKND